MTTPNSKLKLLVVCLLLVASTTVCYKISINVAPYHRASVRTWEALFSPPQTVQSAWRRVSTNALEVPLTKTEDFASAIHKVVNTYFNMDNVALDHYQHNYDDNGKVQAVSVIASRIQGPRALLEIHNVSKPSEALIWISPYPLRSREFKVALRSLVDVRLNMNFQHFDVNEYLNRTHCYIWSLEARFQFDSAKITYSLFTESALCSQHLLFSWLQGTIILLCIILPFLEFLEWSVATSHHQAKQEDLSPRPGLTSFKKQMWFSINDVPAHLRFTSRSPHDLSPLQKSKLSSNFQNKVSAGDEGGHGSNYRNERAYFNRIARTFRSVNAWQLVLVAACLTNLVAAVLALSQPHHLIDQRIVRGLGCMFSWISLLQYFETTPALSAVVKTLRKGTRCLGLYFAGMTPVFLGFGFFGMLMFGHICERFSGVTDMLISIFAIMNGDYMHDAFMDLDPSYPILARLFLYGFGIISIMIMLRMVISIIEDSFFASRVFKMSTDPRFFTFARSAQTPHSN